MLVFKSATKLFSVYAFVGLQTDIYRRVLSTCIDGVCEKACYLNPIAMFPSVGVGLSRRF